MGHKHSKSKKTNTKNVPPQPKSDFEGFIKEHQLTDGQKIKILALKARPYVSNITNRNTIFNSKEFDLAFINDRNPKITDIQGNDNTNFIYINNNYSYQSSTFNDEYILGVIEARGISFCHHITLLHVETYNDIKYYVVSLLLKPYNNELKPFSILFIKNINPPPKPVITVEDGKTITRTTFPMSINPDPPLPLKVMEVVNKYAKERSLDEQWYIINLNNSDCLRDKYPDKCLNVFEV